MQKLTVKPNAGSAYLNLPDNTRQFPEQARVNYRDGLKLTDIERSYLLPHFLMLIIGKPGSGKTTLMKHLLLDSEFYRNKFDKVLLVSPSAAKVGLPVDPQDQHNEFDLFWIYSKLQQFNDTQKAAIAKIQQDNINAQQGTQNESEKMNVFTGQSKKVASIKTLGQNKPINAADYSNRLMPNSLDIAVANSGTQMQEIERLRMVPQLRNTINVQNAKGKTSLMYEARLHSLYNKHLNKLQKMNNREMLFGPPTVERMRKKQNLKSVLAMQKRQLDGALSTMSKQQLKAAQSEFFGNFINQASEIEKYYQMFATEKQREQHRLNVLLILDDCIGQIKEMQNDQYLAQLFFNRRHLLANGTISIMLLSQKYTMIPIRIRSNANWVVLFRLNPIDFENIFKDIFTGSAKQWRELLTFVFGDEEENLIELSHQRKGKTFDNLGIWTEKDIYFKNFAQIVFDGNVVNQV